MDCGFRKITDFEPAFPMVGVVTDQPKDLMH